MAGTVGIPEVYVKRRSSPDPLGRPLSLAFCRRSLYVLGALILLVAVVQFERGRNHEYQAMSAASIASEERAKRAEAQLALMIQDGDRGTLIARLGRDLEGYEIRLVPGARR